MIAADTSIDVLLKALSDRQGRALRLSVGNVARVLEASGTPVDVTQRALTQPDILALVAPMLSDAARQKLTTEGAVTFLHHAVGIGLHKVTMLTNGPEIAVTIVPDSSTPPPVVVPTTAPAVAVVTPATTGHPSGATPSASAASASVTASVGPPAAVEPVVAVRRDTHAIDGLFRAMIAVQASDLHLSSGMPPLVRKDGRMQRLDPAAPALTPDDVVALLDPIMPSQNREEFARRHDSDFAYEIKGLARFRANVFLDRKGRGAVFRVIPADILTAEQLGLSPHILQLCRLSKGLVLVTGPTGSGKSTTLCAMIDHINRTRHDHIITIEDPIEFVHENKNCLINQREVRTHTDGFKDALRAALREDPDIVLVGELRDLETVAIAIETAETGHLVFGTLHTTTAPSTVDRVIDQFPTEQQAQIRIMLSESLKGVIAQTLCRKIGGGRVAALEVLMVTSGVSNLIREAKTFQIPSMMQVGRNVGMVTLTDALMDLVTRKLVEPDEAYVKAVDKPAFEAALKRGGFDTRFVQAPAT